MSSKPRVSEDKRKIQASVTMQAKILKAGQKEADIQEISFSQYTENLVFKDLKSRGILS